MVELTICALHSQGTRKGLLGDRKESNSPQFLLTRPAQRQGAAYTEDPSTPLGPPGFPSCALCVWLRNAPSLWLQNLTAPLQDQPSRCLPLFWTGNPASTLRTPVPIYLCLILPLDFVLAASSICSIYPALALCTRLLVLSLSASLSRLRSLRFAPSSLRSLSYSSLPSPYSIYVPPSIHILPGHSLFRQSTPSPPLAGLSARGISPDSFCTPHGTAPSSPFASGPLPLASGLSFQDSGLADMDSYDICLWIRHHISGLCFAPNASGFRTLVSYTWSLTPASDSAHISRVLSTLHCSLVFIVSVRILECIPHFSPASVSAARSTWTSW